MRRAPADLDALELVQHLDGLWHLARLGRLVAEAPTKRSISATRLAWLRAAPRGGLARLALDEK